MNMQSDLLKGWHDNTATNHREHWQDGIRGRHGHRSGISSDSPYREFREPWGHFPDVPRNVQEIAA